MPEPPFPAPTATATPVAPGSRGRRFLLLGAVWTAPGLLIAGQVQLQLGLRGQTRSFASVLGVSLLGCWVWALYTPPLAALARRLRRRRDAVPAGTAPAESARRRWADYLACHFVCGTLITLALSAVWAAFVPFLEARPSTWGSRFVATLVMNAFFYVGVVGLTEAADYARLSDARAREAAALAERAAALQARLDEARLHALEAQLRPHFLYNTLNVIAELVHDAPDRADAMLTRLGALLRRGGGGGGADTPHLVPLAEEAAFVRAYAELFAERFGDRVRFAVHLPADAGPLLVPAYALQPLVENAFRHGARRREGATDVAVAAAVWDDTLVVNVTDRPRGVGWEPPEPVGADPTPCATDGEGVGLRNTRERLAALFGPSAGLTLAREGDGTTATLWVPRRLAERPAERGDAHEAPLATVPAGAPAARPGRPRPARRGTPHGAPQGTR